VSRLLSKRVIAAFCLLLLLLFLLRPGAGWMKARVTNSISQALGRSLEIGSVRLRFLPRPGFEINDLLVRDGSGFGAEPLLRAPDVTAAVSLSALLRGRMEIARLSLSEPSLNLTRNQNGQWNLEDLIDRTSHSSMAPTGADRQKSKGPSFPYVEATDARVNLKLGTEKTHFALTNAEFALWQESADTWGARLQARPIRTDANLTDTGIINLTALWRRSAQVHETPIQVSFQWRQAQIGQVSKLVYGTEKDWRGAALLSGTVAGTPARLRVVADATIDNFRREDVINGENLRLAAHCVAEYAPASHEVGGLDCTGPVGSGYLQLKGGAGGLLANGQVVAASNLWLVLNRAPARSLVNLLQHARPEFPQDLQISGEITSSIQFLREYPTRPLSIQGKGSITQLEIARNGGDAIGFGSIPFSVSNGADSGPLEGSMKARMNGSRSQAADPQLQELRAEIGPVNLASGRPGPLTAQAIFTRTGFTGSEHGDASIARLLLTAKALGLPSPGFSGDGIASVNLHASGAWFSDEKPLVTGTAHLRTVHAQIRGVNAAVTIQSADLAIDPGAVTVQNLSANAGDSRWHGSLRIPRPCPNPSDCELQFKLRGDKLSSATLNNLLNPSQRPKAWYRFLSLGKEQPSYLLQARASGTITIDSLSLGSASCAHFTTDLELEAGKVAVQNFRIECLDGTATGAWKADFTDSPPIFTGSGGLDGVSLGTIAQLMHDGWIEGRGHAEYRFKSSGSNLQDLLNSADLNAEFRISGGRFAHIVFTRDSGPLRASDFSGALQLAEGAISFRDAKLTSGGEVYTVSGTASLGGALNLKAVNDNAGGYAIGGTFVKTRVSAIPNAEASLKP
jgi:hypothetical protein